MLNLTYQRLTMKYADSLCQMWSDPEVILYTNIATPCTLSETMKRISALCDFDVFVLLLNQEVVGLAGCPPIDLPSSQFGIFYHIHKKYWGQGIATQATNWLLDYMKNKYGNCIIFADVVDANIASDKILQKFNFQHFSTEQNKFIISGKSMLIKNYKLLL